MRNLLRKIHFGQLLRKFSLNRPIIRLKFAQNLPQTGFPSQRLSFSDSLLVPLFMSTVEIKLEKHTKRLQMNGDSSESWCSSGIYGQKCISTFLVLIFPG